MRGPPRTPTAILRARGSWRAKTRPGEPEAPKTKPRMPRGLNAAGKRAWTRTLAALEQLGVLSAVDAGAIERYAWLTQRFWQFTRKAEEGDDAAEVRALAISRDLLKIEAQFGLTPSARASLSVDAKAGKSDTPFGTLGKTG